MRSIHMLPRAICLLLALAAPESAAQPGAGDPPSNEQGEPSSIAERTAEMRTLEGLVSLRIDDTAGRVWLVAPPPDEDGVVGEYIYVHALRSGLGSNPVGLDRGQLGRTRVVALRAVGDRLLVEQQNTSFRAESEEPAERRAVEESFATSILWGGPIEHRDPDGSILVDLTSFIIRDAHGVADRLRRTDQGAYTLDRDRSVFDPASALAFPNNVVLESIITFVGGEPGGFVRSVAPDAETLSFRQRHMLIRLPDDSYTPRRFDPRVSSFAVTYLDYAAPLEEPLERGWIVRHRLERVDPDAPRSRAREPILYYVDRGAPEPVRRALVEGARWWSEAFEAAGFVDAFQVEVAPSDVHPLDVRHNFIQWVHRSTRGWSYGSSITDPRTGEIIKGHVSLGSLRVRHDRLIFEALAGVEKTGSGDPDDPVQIALARIRQLSAHEVGHTLGFAHNFAASAQDRASVMDYPAPYVRLRPDETIDFSQAYDTGIGEWDIHATRYAYAQFPPGADEEAELEKIIREGIDRGMLFISDRDARPAGAAHPLANLWDNGEDPIDELERLLELRAAAIKRFGERNIADGRPLAHLQEVFAPLYLLHRYQVEAAVKSVGGLMYAYSVRGDGQGGAEPVDAETQRRALRTLLRTIEPETLAIPDSVAALLLPRPFGEGGNRELFDSDTGLVFDPHAAASAAADLTISLLLHPDRCARVAQQRLQDERNLGLHAMLETIVEQIIDTRATRAAAATLALRRIPQRILIERLIELAQNPDAAPDVRGHAEEALKAARSKLNALVAQPEWHRRALRERIDRHFERGFDAPPAMDYERPAPPGSPIGADGAWPLGPDFGACAGGGFHDHSGGR